MGCGFDIHEMLGTKMRALFLDLTPSIYAPSSLLSSTDCISRRPSAIR